jgi:hypothetical protein
MISGGHKPHVMDRTAGELTLDLGPGAGYVLREACN